MLSHPISRTYFPLFLGIFIISQLSSEQTLYSLTLCHHHSQHLSPYQQRDYFPSQKGLFNFQLLSHPISRYNPTVNPPTPSAEPMAPFLLEKIIISLFSSYQSVYSLILCNHHSLHLSPHQQRNSIFPIKKGYLIISCYPTPSEEPSLQLTPHPNPSAEPIVPFFGKTIMSQF